MIRHEQDLQCSDPGFPFFGCKEAASHVLPCVIAEASRRVHLHAVSAGA